MSPSTFSQGLSDLLAVERTAFRSYRRQGPARGMLCRRLRLEALESRWLLSVAPSLSLAAPQDFTAGGNPYFISLADFNSDGRLDLAVANTGSAVSVLLNTTATGSTTASFADKQDFSTDPGVRGVAVADFNGDGRPDLAAACYGSGAVSVLLNTTTPGAATASFGIAQDFSTGAGTSSVAVADFNGDGRPDLVTANTNSFNASVLLNTTVPGAATPTFASRLDLATGSRPYSVVTGDINGDGKPDVAVAFGSGAAGGATVLLNTTTLGATTPSFAGGVNFTSGYGYPSATCASIADFNRDGKSDLAVTCQGTGQVWVAVNSTPTGNSTPAFGANLIIQADASYGVVAADLNCDGKPDMAAVSNATSSAMWVYLNTTTPGGAYPSFGTNLSFSRESFVRAVAAGDLNGDGKPDLITANSSAGTVSVFLNTTELGNPTVSMAEMQEFDSDTTPNSVVTADFNLDGQPDLAAANWGDNTVSVLMNITTRGDTTASFATTQYFDTGENPAYVTVGDFNGDGRPDLAVANCGSDTVSVLLNETTPGDTTPSFAAKQDFTVGSGAYAIAVGDLNGDGLLDLAVANRDADTVSVLLNETAPGATTPSFATKQDFGTGNTPYAISVGDLNGDGKLDLAVSNRDADTVSVLLNTTTTGATSLTFATKRDFATGWSPFGVVLGDLNGDGQPDLVIASQDFDEVSVLLNTTAPGATTPSFATKQDFDTGRGPRSVSLRDLDGDGKLDIAVTNTGDNTISVLLNNTTPGATTFSFAAKQDFDTGWIPSSAAIADFNSDFTEDLAVANYGYGTISVLLNTTPLVVLTPTVSVTISGGEYNGSAFAATDASATGEEGLVLATFGDPTLSYSYYSNGTLLGDAPRNVGDYTVVAHYTSDNPDYRSADSEAVAFSITALPITVTARTDSKVYDGTTSAAAEPTITEGALASGDTATWIETYDTKDVGIGKTLTPSGTVDDGNGGNNYLVSFVTDTTGTITAKALTITADDQTKAYGAELPPLTASYDGFIDGETPADLTTLPTLSTTATAESHVSGNPYAITADGAAATNYEISYEAGTLTVTPVSLTITADDKTKVYGDPLPELTASYDGFVNGDTPDSLSTPVSLSTTATETSPVGTYPITASGAASADYTISYVAGELSITPATGGPDTIGLYDPATGTFYLRNSNTTGVADYTFAFGDPSQDWKQLIGDWDGNGGDTVGFFDPVTCTWYLRNSLTTGVADVTFAFGAPSLTHGNGDADWIPLVGDWDGDGTDTVGFFDPVNCFWYLRDSLSTGIADYVFAFGASALTTGQGDANWQPRVGDWNGNGTDTVGFFDPLNCFWYLRDSLTTGSADYMFACGAPAFTVGHGADNWQALVGNWDGTRGDTIGFYDPQESVFMLRNSLTTGAADMTFGFGAGGAGWQPLVGTWQAKGAEAAMVAQPTAKAVDQVDLPALVADEMSVSGSYGPNLDSASEVGLRELDAVLATGLGP